MVNGVGFFKYSFGISGNSGIFLALRFKLLCHFRRKVCFEFFLKSVFKGHGHDISQNLFFIFIVYNASVTH